MRGRSVAVVLVVWILLLGFPHAASADTLNQVTHDPTFTNVLLSWFMPLGIALVAIGLSTPSRGRRLVTALPLALAVALLVYTLCGYAFQFGGVGLISDDPDLAGLIAEWSPLDRRLGPGWGVVGLRGFLFTPDASTATERSLFVSQLTFLTTAVLIPLITLRERMGGSMRLFLVLLGACFCYPLMGNWVYGGGWLSQLGETLDLGQGFIDQGLASAHLVGGGLALAGGVASRYRSAEGGGEDASQLPLAHLPLVLMIGALLALVGWLAAVLSFPLATASASPWTLFLNALWGVVGSVLASLFYGWLVRGEMDAGLMARGMLAGQVAVSAGVSLFSPWQAALVGFASGLLLAPAMYLVEHVWDLEDAGGPVSVHGFCALVGILAAGLFVSPRAGRVQQLYAQLIGAGSLLCLSLLLPGALLMFIVRLQTLPKELEERARERALALERERVARERLRQRGLSLTLWQRLRMRYLHIVAARARRLAKRSRLTAREREARPASGAQGIVGER